MKNDSLLRAIVAGCAVLLCTAGCTKEFAGESEAVGSQVDRRARAGKFLKQFETKSGDFLTEEDKAFLLSDLEDVRIIRLVSVKKKDITKSAVDFGDDCFIEFEDSLVFETADADTSAQDFGGRYGREPSFFGEIESGHYVFGECPLYIRHVDFYFSGVDNATHKVVGYFATCQKQTRFTVTGVSDGQSYTETDGHANCFKMDYTVSSGKGHCSYRGSIHSRQ